MLCPRVKGAFAKTKSGEEAFCRCTFTDEGTPQVPSTLAPVALGSLWWTPCRTALMWYVHVHRRTAHFTWADGHWTGPRGWAWRGWTPPPSQKTRQSMLPKGNRHPRAARSMHAHAQSTADRKEKLSNSHKLKAHLNALLWRYRKRNTHGTG